MLADWSLWSSALGFLWLSAEFVRVSDSTTVIRDGMGKCKKKQPIGWLSVTVEYIYGIG